MKLGGSLNKIKLFYKIDLIFIRYFHLFYCDYSCCMIFIGVIL